MSCCSAQSQRRAPAVVTEMLDDGGGEDFEEEILVGFFVLPAAAALCFGFRACADGDKNYAVGFGLLERVLETLAGERGSVDVNGVAGDFEAFRLAGVEPGAAVLSRTSRAPSRPSSRARPSSCQPRG